MNDIDIDDLVEDMVFEVAAWMPTDDEAREEFFDSDPDHQKEIINKNMDNYFGHYLDMEEEGEWVSQNRQKIIDKLWYELNN